MGAERERGNHDIKDAPGNSFFTGLGGSVLMCLFATVGGFFTGSIGTGSDIAVCESQEGGREREREKGKKNRQIQQTDRQKDR